MTLKERIESFADLGEQLRNALEDKPSGIITDLDKIIECQQDKNPWFTPGNVRLALEAISRELTFDNLTEWTNNYPSLDSSDERGTTGVIMAGNIPLAGFHDFLSVLIAGSRLIAKTSSKDSGLIVYMADLLKKINPAFGTRITVTETIMKGFDAVIATGSNNSSRYFEYYFGRYPHIIRKNRNSVAVIVGDETGAEIHGLGTDIFSYFGLGCRNVSKIFIPTGFDLSDITRYWHDFESVINHNKYINNYDYNRALYMVNKESFADTGYILIKESNELSSPVSVLYFEYYNSLSDVFTKIEAISEKIQCVVNRNRVPYGSAQSPHLWDYADGIDTIEFLLKKN